MYSRKYFPNLYQNINFIEKYSQLKEVDGKVLGSFKIVVPDFWSQTSADIIAQKYARRAGVPRYLKKIHEDNVPVWLQRSEEDVDAFLKENHGKIDINEFSQDSHLRYEHEDDARMIFERVAGCWAYWGWKGGYFEAENDACDFYQSTVLMMINQEAAANSPQQFNGGIHWAYGIKGQPQGHFYYDAEQKDCVRSTSAYEHPQLHACFILSVNDSLLGEGGILDLATKEATAFKYGSGTGSNFSALRAKNEPLSGGGSSSGLMSFLGMFDKVAGALKSGGKTRRSAKMNTIDVNHPEILDYITCKMHEENKVASMITGSKNIKKHLDNLHYAAKHGECDVNANPALASAIIDAHRDSVPVELLIRALSLLEQGVDDIGFEVFTADFNGSAYASVNMQNANNSIRVTDEFMRAVIDDDYFKLTNRTNPKEYTQVKARKIWDSLCLSAWSCGDPGIQMDDTIASWHTCPASGRINGSNPCSEYMFLDDTACNLASLNLVKFQLKNGRLDTDKFVKAVKTWLKALEISVFIAQYPSRLIASNSHKFRPLGLGYANLGSFLMRAGIPYDSDEARSIAGYITAVMHGVSYKTSAELASKLGAFEGYQLNREHMMRVICNHRHAVFGELCDQVNIQPRSLDHTYLTNVESEFVKNLWDDVVDHGHKYGFRNSQVTVLAPTGTIGLMMGCNTTGVEPQYMLITHKKLSGGGYMKLVDESVNYALMHLGYTNDQIDAINKHIVGHGSLAQCDLLNHEALLNRGFTKENIAKIESALPDVFDVSNAFSEFIIGSEIYDHLHIPADQRNGSSLLKQLIPEDKIKDLNLYVCGHMCIENAPFIKPDHLQVFDCAVPNGEHGKRSIATKGHVLMVSTAQSFLSGAISKTFNQRQETKVTSKTYDTAFDAEDVESISDVFMLCYKHGVKCTTVFRDGSKMSAPLGSFSDNKILSLLRSVNSAPDSKTKLKRGERELLPNKRYGYTQKVTVSNDSIYHTTGENVGGELRELFITASGREGSAFRSIMNAFAKSISLGLQYGVPLEEFIHAFVFMNFPPSGLVSGHKHIKKIYSIIDYIMRDLAINYCNMMDLANVQNAHKEDVANLRNNITHKRVTNTTSIDSALDATQLEIKKARMLGYTGEFCAVCREARMIYDGTCSICEACSNTTGC